MTMLTIIAAVDKTGVIGRDGQLPWHLPDDLAHFKRQTAGQAVIMGRKTHQSILASLGGPLPGRRSIVISRQAGNDDRVEWADSLQAALDLAPSAYVIGGGQIYRLAIDRADQLLITEVDVSLPAGDTYLPAIDLSVWREVERHHHPADARHHWAFDFVTYRRD